MITPRSRLYVQLRPSEEDVAHYGALQKKVHDGAPVPEHELHMTVIHIGEYSRFMKAVRNVVDVPYERLLEVGEQLAVQLKAIAQKYAQPLTLTPLSVAEFGKTLAVEYKPSDELRELHRESLDALRNIVTSLGVDNVDEFLASDDNLKFTLTLRPHVAFVRRSHSGIKTADLKPAEFTVMKVRY